MSSWKRQGKQHIKPQSAKKRVISVAAWLALAAFAWPNLSAIALAQQAENRITNISVSGAGELIIQVDGEGFDPLLRLEATQNGTYRIVVKGEGVSLAPGLTQELSKLGGVLRGKIPAIEQSQISPLGGQGQGFQLVLTAWRKLQPQILSNDGQHIIIRLAGDRSAPQAIVQRRILADKNRLAQAARQAKLQQQAALKAEMALKHEAELEMLAQARQEAELKRQQEQEQFAEQQIQVEQQRQTALAVQQRQVQERAAHEQEQQRLAEQARLSKLATEQENQRQANLRRQQAAPKTSQPVASTSNAEQQRLKEIKLRAEMAELKHQETLNNQEETLYQAELQREKLALEKQRQQALQHQRAKDEAWTELSIDRTTAPASPAAKLSAEPQKQKATAGQSTTRTTNNTAKAKIAAKPMVAKATPSLPPNTTGWQTAYSAQQSSPEEPVNQLQLVQQNGGSAAGTIEGLRHEVRPLPLETSMSGSPASMPSAQQAKSQTVPVNFDGTTEDTDNDNAPNDPLKLTKPPADFSPANFTPADEEPSEPDKPKAEGQPPARQGKKATPIRPAHPHSRSTHSKSSNDEASPLNSIYAVINSPTADPSLHKAWEELMAGHADSAQSTLRQRLKIAPNDFNARYLLAEILLSPMNDSQASMNATQSAARREEARQELLKNYAQTLHWPSCQALLELFLEEGKLEEATRLMAQVSQAYPNEAGVIYEQARIYEAMDDLNAARASFQQALALQPTNPEIHYRLAQVELKAGRLDAARWELLQGLSWSPNDSRMLKLLGYIADKSGQAPQAAKAYRQALPVDAMINYARTLEAQHQPEQALNMYQAVEAVAGDNPDILFNLGMIYHNTHRTSRAMAVLNRFVSLNSDQRDSRVGKAKTLLRQMATGTP